MARKEQNQERKVYVTIRSKRKPVRFETWRYWEIVGELQFQDVDRFESYDAARWCARTAKPGDKLELSCGILLEVSENA